MSDEREREESRNPVGEGRHKVDVSGAAYAGIGLQFAALILVFVFAGQWLDKRFDSQWFTIVGVFVGATLGIASMYRRLMADQRREDAARRSREPKA
ncbi:MAG TPA: AtpZ/AtpI family protein [Gemmatimonadaceae bacterium]|nr:AtpZ/AtpI family protein [Gemmatimonadaceae bacterium]